jgi:hypothetical protein
MTKNKFAGLADAKQKALASIAEENPQQEEDVPQKPDGKQAIKQVNKLTGKLVSKGSAKRARRVLAEAENLVGVTIKIPEDKRIWWNVQAKLQRTTVTDAIIEALDKRFGEPKF